LSDERKAEMKWEFNMSHREN